MKHKAIDTLVDHIRLYPSVEKIILYGSRARGDNTPYSDIDLAIEGTIDRNDWRNIRQLADVDDPTIRTLLKIDLVNTAMATDELRQSIATEGQVLYERH